MKKIYRRIIACILIIFTIFNTLALCNVKYSSYNSIYASDAIAYNGQSTVGTYYISTPAQLNLLSEKVNSGVTYENSLFILKNNIVFESNTSGNFTQIGTKNNPFMADFDGCNYTISGIIIKALEDTNESTKLALIGHLKNGTIRNVGIDIFDFSKVSVRDSGLLVGINENGTVDSCHSYSTHDSRTAIPNVVSFVYQNDGNMINCYNEADIFANNTGLPRYGVICTNNNGTIKKCYNNGKINIGGDVIDQGCAVIAYYNNGEIIECYNTGTISSSAAAGIASYNNGTIKQCYNTGTISSSAPNNWEAGGITLSNASNGTIEDCYNLGDVAGENGSGGIAAINSGIIRRCYNKGSISGEKHGRVNRPHQVGIGGIVGELHGGKVEYCYNMGYVSSTHGQAGGIVGLRTGFSLGIISCYNVGGTSQNGKTSGGIIGWNNTSYLIDTSEIVKIDIGDDERPIVLDSYGGTKEFQKIINSYYLLSECDYASMYVGYTGTNGGDYATKPEIFGRSTTYGLNITQMQVQSFVDTLNSSGENAFIRDSGLSNGGYPIFKWQQQVTSIEVIGDTNIEENKFNTFKLKVLPDSIEDMTFSWTSEDNKIASVSPVGNGLSAVIYGLKKGYTTITVTANDKNKYSVSFTVIIVSPLIQGKSGYYLVGEEIEYLTDYYDEENDPKYCDEFKYIHTTDKFENSIKVDNAMGQISYNNRWLRDKVISFDKVGTYEINYRVIDNPPTANTKGFENYRYNSQPAKSIIYVHRKPTAFYTVNNYTVTDESYDIDHSVSYSNKGIIKWEWTYINDEGITERYTATNKTVGQNKVNQWLSANAGTSYELILRVLDMEEVWSDAYSSKMILPDNNPPTVNFSIMSNETPEWVFPQNIGNKTLIFRPSSTFFTEENVKVVSTAFDPDENNEGFTHSWKIERFLVNNISGITSTPYQTFSSTNVVPTINTFSSSYGWGAYRITYTATDKPPIPPYADKNKKSATVTKNYYVIPEITLNTSYECSDNPVKIGSTLTLKAQTNSYVTSVVVELDGNLITLSKASTTSGTINWTSNYVIPSTFSGESGLCDVKYTAYTNYGGNGANTRQIEKLDQIYILANTAPVIVGSSVITDINDTFIYEGDNTDAVISVNDDDHTPLKVTIDVYKRSDLANKIIPTITKTVTPVGTSYPLLRCDLINNIPIGDYRMVVVVSDNEAAPITEYVDFTAHDLFINGKVNHTAKWEENRQTYNLKYPGKARSDDTYWSGEAFETSADTTVIDANSSVRCTKVSVEIINSLNPSDDKYLQWMNSYNVAYDKWKLYYASADWNNKWGNTVVQQLTLRFKAYFSNDWIETDDVIINIDNIDPFWLLHRVW